MTFVCKYKEICLSFMTSAPWPCDSRIEASHDNFYGENLTAEDDGLEWNDETYWTEDFWSEDPWSFPDEEYYQEMDVYGWYDDESYYEDYEGPTEWQGNPDSEPGHQGGEEESYKDGAEGVYSAGGYRGGKSKGKGAFGSGCHMVSACLLFRNIPVSNIGGKGKGKNTWAPGKSYGKGYKGFKGRGKGKGKSKGKNQGKWNRKGSFSSPEGPRSWMPRYYADYSSKTDRQLRHAQQGLHLGEPPSLPTGSQSAQYYNMTNDKGVKETYFEDLLRLERTATISYKEHATAADPSAEHNADGGELPSKRLSFFRKSIEGEEIRTPRHSTHYGHSDGMEVYLTIQGRRRRGLIIDPGAANGLVGSETLRDLLQHCDLSEQVKSSITWAEKQSEVTGISGSADTTLGEVLLRLPMLKGLRDASYEEFYSKSGKMPVTPRNYDRWCRTKSSRAPVHLWELFSGSSRLSYLALLAGLTVAFPVDFRYGWNLGCAAHQNMILNAQDRLNPEVIVMSPSFPMSTRPPSKKSSEQEDQVEFEMKAMHFVRLWQADKLRRDALSDKLYVETLHLGNFAERYLRMPSTTTN
eukprot:s6027_g1.t1